MSNQIWEELGGAGVDCADGLQRMNGSEALYLKLLGKFLADRNYASFLECSGAGDKQQAAIYLHALKGLAANLSMKRLQSECVIAEAAMRAGEPVKNMDKLQAAYGELESVISRMNA